MPDLSLISGRVIKWKVVDGKATVDNAEPVSGAFEDTSDDLIKLKLLAEWLGKQAKEGKDIPNLLAAVGQGLLTVEIENRLTVRPPAITQPQPQRQVVELADETVKKIEDLLAKLPKGR